MPHSRLLPAAALVALALSGCGGGSASADVEKRLRASDEMRAYSDAARESVRCKPVGSDAFDCTATLGVGVSGSWTGARIDGDRFFPGESQVSAH